LENKSLETIVKFIKKIFKNFLKRKLLPILQDCSMMNPFKDNWIKFSKDFKNVRDLFCDNYSICEKNNDYYNSLNHHEMLPKFQESSGLG
jgi:hypothetical protein